MSEVGVRRRRPKPKDYGLAAINGGGWGSVEPLLHQLGADIVAVAEHRLSGERLLATRHRLLRNGWRSAFRPLLAGQQAVPARGWRC